MKLFLQNIPLYYKVMQSKSVLQHITHYISLHNCDHPDFQNEHPLTFLNAFLQAAMQDKQNQK